MNDIRLAIRTVNLIRCGKLIPKNVHKGTFALIVKSLQKQIPKKLIRNEVNNLCCPSCNGPVVICFSYCPNCGQAWKGAEQDEP